jgi:hypothetical protein
MLDMNLCQHESLCVFNFNFFCLEECNIVALEQELVKQRSSIREEPDVILITEEA